MLKKFDHVFVVLAYKESPYLGACIDSLQAQTLKSEIIICTSTPSVFLEEIASDAGVPLLVNTRSDGIAADWNFALNATSASYVTLAHQDDLYHPDYTALFAEAAARHPDALILFSDYSEQRGVEIIVSNTLLRIKRMIRFPFFLHGESLARIFFKKLFLSFGSPIPCPSVMYHKATIGDFRFSDRFRINMDWHAWITLSQRPGSFVGLKEKLLIHRIHPQSATSEGIANQDRMREDHALFRLLWKKPAAWLLFSLYRLGYRSND